ncbi:MAG: MBL fold metallo-hydrolase, partial [Clostridium sp.]
MRLTFIGADHEVTGSCHFLEAAGLKILVDCGMEQGSNDYENQDLPVSYSDIDYVLVTHSHIDHVGMLPFIYAGGFKGKIMATKATCDLCEIMLKDCAHIQESEAEWKNRKARRAGRSENPPLYTMNDAVGVLEHFVPCDYNQIIKLNDGLEIRFIDVGHLLGSSSIEVWMTEGDCSKKIVFSGDIG